MIKEILDIRKKALAEIEDINDKKALEDFRIRYLGKKGLITLCAKRIGELPQNERPEAGRICNQVKGELQSVFQKKKNQIESKERALKYTIDVTLPGRAMPRGHLHPLTQTIKDVCEIFKRMGYSIAKGPNVELDYYNFEALNIPKDHPARDMQDTFYVSENTVLRTHTSPIQIRVMESHPPPVQIIAPGRVYRRDSDISHTPMFHQVEGLLVDKGISFADLKGTLSAFVHEMFGKETELRFRPSFFPFTEPSAEVDIKCVICGGNGCRTCGGTGWLEILGSGMVDPKVFGFVGYDPQVYTGFAFGMGIERIAMLRYQIDDIHLFFRNDVQFLTQF